MSKQNFHMLLSRYRSGNCTEREKQLVEQWFSMLGEETASRSERESDQIEEKLWKTIQFRKDAEAEKVKPLRPVIRWKWAAAAAVVIAATWWIAFKSPLSLSKSQEVAIFPEMQGLQKKTNKTASNEKVILADGTEVLLAPKSSIEYPAAFEGDTRKVFLTGKAFFKVVSNPDMPFLVHSGDIITKVLGTSFWIDGSDKTKAIEVSVVTGKVSVSRRTEASADPSGRIKSGVFLTANQKVTYSSESYAFETGLVENPVLVATETKEVQPQIQFLFDDAPIFDVIHHLEKAYGIEIILENDALKNCLFRGDITLQPLFTKLDLLCSSVNATYEIRGTRILISGKGCSTSNPNPMSNMK